MKTVGLIGSMTGRLGNSVAFSRNGQQIFRVYQPNVANPNTFRQRVSRARFTELVNLASSIGVASSIGLAKNRRAGETNRNVFMRVNSAAVRITGVENNNIVPEVSYEELTFSKGDLTPPTFSTMSFSTPKTVTIPRGEDTTGIGDAEATDRIYIVVYSAAFGAVSGFFGTRSDENYTVTLPGQMQGATVHVYAYAVKLPPALNGVPDTQVPYRTPPVSISATVYLGSGTVN